MEHDYLPELGQNGWNDDPAWVSYIGRFDEVRRAIAQKYAGKTDEAFIEDCMQVAYIALMTVRPERIQGYEYFSRGEIEIDDWNQRLDKYCRNVIKYSVLSFLKSPSTGPLYYGRYKVEMDLKTGKVKKTRRPSLFLPLEEMLASGKYQVDSYGHMISGDTEDDIEYLYHNNE